VSCPSEATLAVHADEELPREEARRTEEHLAGCPRCRALFEALRAEGRVLRHALEDAPASAPARGRSGLVAVALAVVSAAAGLQALLGWLGDVARETPLALVDGRSVAVSVLFETFFYLLREGASMLTSLVTVSGLVALVLLTAAVGLSRRRRRPAAALALFALVTSAGPAAALERRVARTEHESIVVGAGETVDDSLLAVGDSVTVDGIVTGNLIACGRRVVVRGTVKGDLVTAAQTIEIEGPVEGNVITFSETVSLRGPVAKSAHSFGERVGLAREGRVDGDVFAFAAEADVDGRVGRDLFAFAGLTNMRGEVARNATARTGRLRVEGPAKIGGNLVARVEKKEAVSVDPQATVGGKTETRIPEAKRSRSRYARPGFYVWKVIWLAAAFLTGLLVHRLFPWLFSSRLEGGGSIMGSIGIGFLVLVAGPVAALVVGVTMVGLPLALLALGLWLAGLYLSSILVGELAGRALLARGERPGPSFALRLLVGLLVVTVASNIPYLGALLGFVVVLLGLGLGVAKVRQVWKPLPA
jgi:anti-sigma factor RsiW